MGRARLGSSLGGVRTSALLLALIVGCATAQQPHVRVSSLGYTGVVPPGWIAIGQREIAGHEAELDAAISGSVDEAAGGEALSRMRENIRSGNIEYLVPETRPANSFDNINVQLTGGQIPPLGTDITALCDPLPRQLSTVFRRQITVHRCSLVLVANHPAVVIEADGGYEDSVVLEYVLNHSPGKVLTITATLSVSTVESYRPAVRSFVESVVLPES